ncbi:SSU ribosomal protein S30P [Candidatus Sulfotelmatobacter kueseliae]|uniref:Ribosome hibernation promoting factor n=1 Tax=Candidatus Sulfotelmatobacter kueseliae TaxID=2042962 RepID=A0A2U3JV64_9BACT|nr:SSU ribosomal protein S30P [Candidatus Sulfotelmatobacter kueseliae]
MNVEYTGRHYEVTSTIRKEVETGLAKIRKILGDRFETKVILAVEKHRHKAEITISPRNGPLVGLAQAKDMSIAVNEALDHLEKQAIKYKARWQSKKRSARKTEEANKWNGDQSGPQEEVQTAVGLTEKTAVPVVVHKYPAVAKTTEVHLVRSDEAVAMRPMTLEEAIKEAHFKDRDVFVFRDPKGKVMVLHRARDGKMELIEVP